MTPGYVLMLAVVMALCAAVTAATEDFAAGIAGFFGAIVSFGMLITWAAGASG